MRRLGGTCGVLVAILAWCLAAGATAQTPYDALTPVSDADLADQRGGFIEAGGFTFDFAADVKTYVDGHLVLQSQVDWADLADAAPQKAQVALSNATGTTVVQQQISSNGVLSLVLNSASNRSVVQSINLSLTLPGFADVQQQMSQQRLGLALADQLSGAMIRSR